jgi:hypothetical protein
MNSGAVLGILLGLGSLSAAYRFYAGLTTEATAPHERRQFLKWRLPLGAPCASLPIGLGWILIGVSNFFGTGLAFLILSSLGAILLVLGIVALFWQPRWLQPRWLRELEQA